MNVKERKSWPRIRIKPEADKKGVEKISEKGYKSGVVVIDIEEDYLPDIHLILIY